MTKYEWRLLRKRQGHNIITCRCGFTTPEYLFWIHLWNTGHATIEELGFYHGSS